MGNVGGLGTCFEMGFVAFLTAGYFLTLPVIIFSIIVGIVASLRPQRAKLYGFITGLVVYILSILVFSVYGYINNIANNPSLNFFSYLIMNINSPFHLSLVPIGFFSFFTLFAGFLIGWLVGRIEFRKQNLIFNKANFH